MYCKEKIDVSIIIVNYNTCKLLQESIDSVKQKTYNINYEIIVVDNNSNDGSQSIIKLFFPDVTFIECNENLGFGKANNLGATYANGEYLFLLNTDTLLINNAIEILYKFMCQAVNKNVAICGGNLFTKDLNHNYSYSNRYPSLLNLFLYRSQLRLSFKKADFFNSSANDKDVAIIIGADFFIRKKIYEEVKGFDPNFFMYIEDGDLCFRVYKAGYRIVSVPEAKIIHYQGKSSTTGEKLIMEVTGYIYYFKKHHKSYIVKLYKAMELFFAITKFILFSIFLNKKNKMAYMSLIKFLSK
jgi:GT2 family glycosyltransferase